MNSSFNNLDYSGDDNISSEQYGECRGIFVGYCQNCLDSKFNFNEEDNQCLDLKDNVLWKRLPYILHVPKSQNVVEPDVDLSDITNRLDFNEFDEFDEFDDGTNMCYTCGLIYVENEDHESEQADEYDDDQDDRRSEQYEDNDSDYLY
jgi:hypothetical protein